MLHPVGHARPSGDRRRSRLLELARRVRERLTGTYWFVPALLTVTAGSAALLLPELDEHLGSPSWLPEPLAEAGPEGVRELLAAIAGSMITVAGVTFSVMIVALSQAAQLYGHRLLRNFMRDRGTHVALGAFVATFVYCVLVLVRVRGGEDSQFVPRLTVGFALLLALASVGVLIFFLHHAAAQLQWNHVIAAAGNELDEAIRRAFPARRDPLGPDPPLVEPTVAVEAREHGYVDAIDATALVELAAERDLRIRLHARVGELVLPGVPLATAGPAERLRERDAQRLREAVAVATQPVEAQEDVLLGIQSLVEIALRALSPSLNNPLTAIDCLDRLGASLVSLVARAPQAQWLDDAGGAARVRLKALTLAEVLEEAFGLLRHSVAAEPAVALREIEMFCALAVVCRRDDLLAALAEQGAALREATGLRLALRRDRERVQRALEALDRVLAGHGEGAEALALRDALLASRGTGWHARQEG